MARHQIGQRQARKYQNRFNLRLNLGCGHDLKPGFVNIDASPPADLVLDLREGLPFSCGSVELIYSEHFFEHLDFPEPAMLLLRESLRVLNPGGRFSLAVPDTHFILKAYHEDDSALFERLRRWHPDWCRTKLDQVNYHFRQGEEHRYAYDFETVETYLRESGFSQIEKREFRPDLDSEERAYGTLYVDAIKPRV